MSNKDDGGQAFPTNTQCDAPGMSMRNYLAAQAMQGLCAHSGSYGINNGAGDIADRSFQIADAMLETKKQLRQIIINEICNEYIEPIISNYQEVCRTSPDVGPYAFDTEIAWYRKLIIELKRQPWKSADAMLEARKQSAGPIKNSVTNIDIEYDVW